MISLSRGAYAANRVMWIVTLRLAWSSGAIAPVTVEPVQR